MIFFSCIAKYLSFAAPTHSILGGQATFLKPLEVKASNCAYDRQQAAVTMQFEEHPLTGGPEEGSHAQHRGQGRGAAKNQDHPKEQPSDIADITRPAQWTPKA